MKQDEFTRLFPHADSKRFKQDYDGTMVFMTDDYVMVDVESNAFFGTFEYVKYLELPSVGLGWWRDDHFKFLSQWKRAYKYRDRDLFPLDVHPKKWGPVEWDVNENYVIPTIPKFFDNKKDYIIPHVNLESFRIYVNNDHFFMLNRKLPWSFKNVREVDFDDEKNEYCNSLLSMYVLSYLGGMSLKNLESDNNLANSLAHFYFYYHLNKFYKYRDMRNYNLTDVKKYDFPIYKFGTMSLMKKAFTTRYEYQFKKTKTADIGDIRLNKGNLWASSDRKKRDLEKDYLRLLLKESSGLSHIGQVLLQESCQAYVYCVLGAQVNTRWKIIGDSANSFQTQRVFMDLVSSVTAQDDVNKLISSMRQAVSATGVRLDFCVSPGLELIPSNMVFIKDVPGYNNTLIVSTRKQKFGVNNVNSTLTSVLTATSQETSQQPHKSLTAKFKQNPSKNQVKNSTAHKSLQEYFKETSQQPHSSPHSTLTSDLTTTSQVSSQVSSQHTLGGSIGKLGDSIGSLADSIHTRGVIVVAVLVTIPIVYLVSK